MIIIMHWVARVLPNGLGTFEESIACGFFLVVFRFFLYLEKGITYKVSISALRRKV
jgi:hypothetical protein